MKIHCSILSLATALALALSPFAARSSAAAVPDPPARPNIILCMADDQGWQETGYNGHTVVKTPILDEMASSGLRFDRFYSAAPNCSPTRGSIMTGRHPNRFGTFAPNWAMRPEEITLAEILKQAGYATGHFGKWHLGPVKAGAPNNPGASGFDEWLSHDNFFEKDPPLSRNGAPPEIHQGESSEIVVRAAIEFIEKSASSQKAFFVVVWFGSPHGPYLGIEQDLRLYSRLEKETLRHRYAEITAMDRAIGQLRTALRRNEVARNTLLWYCSDNGVPGDVLYQPAFNGSKGTLFEGGLRVPAIMEWPERIPQGRSTSVSCVTTDIFPTILDLLGLPLQDRPMDGISLRPLLAGEMKERPSPITFWKYDSGGERKNPPWMDPASQKGTTPTTRNPAIEFLNYRHPVARTGNFGGDASILDGRYKLIIDKKGKRSLYDLEADPREEHDLAGSMETVSAGLEKRLRKWQISVERSLTGADY